MTQNQLLKRAVEILRAGGLVAFPTETVYGLGADARNPEAVAKVFLAKERPATNPLIVHIADVSMLSDWARDVPATALKLAQHFWPGPLTLVLNKKADVSLALTGGQDTVAIRIPRHPLAQQLLSAFGGGIAAPSANKFTRISPTSAKAVQQELGPQVDLILDGGDCEVGLESTIIDLSGETPALLRPGMLNLKTLETVLEMKIAGHSTQIAPGNHFLHYAPKTKTMLLPSEKISTYIQDQNEANIGILTMDELGLTPNEYAHNLYRTLRAMDNQQYHHLVIEAVPATSEWDAIRDRLHKACTKES